MSDSVRPHPWDSLCKNTGVGCHFLLQCIKVKSESEVTQSGLTLCNPMDCSLPGSSAHGIFQARVLEWGAIAFSSKWRNPHSNPGSETPESNTIIIRCCNLCCPSFTTFEIWTSHFNSLSLDFLVCQLAMIVHALDFKLCPLRWGSCFLANHFSWVFSFVEMRVLNKNVL